MTPSESGDVGFGEALRAWLKIAVHSFGGPAGQIAVIHRVVVEEKRWLGEERFLHALSYCMLLPGPEAQQLVTYTGWLMHGVRGGLAAGLLFILPGFLSILGLSLAYAGYRDVGLVAAIFYGLKPAVLAIVLSAVLRLKRRAAAGTAGTVLAALAFLAIFGFGVAFPFVVVGAAVAGLLLAERWTGARDTGGVATDRPSLAALARTIGVWLVIWLTPVVALVLFRGLDDVLTRIALFFSQTALVTFGGAYAVLTYVAQRAVESFGWLTPDQMLDGLGLAETTPGPLIMVVQFVGFMAAWQHGSAHPIGSALAASLITTWVTFAPCFLFIFAGAPWIEYLRGSRRLNAALRGITAAVVGVVLNLAVWFAIHTLFGHTTMVPIGPASILLPAPATIDPGAVVIAIAAVLGVLRFRLGLFPVLAGGALAGCVLRLL